MNQCRRFASKDNSGFHHLVGLSGWLFLVFIFLLWSNPVGAQILTNGGFESGLNIWSSSLSGSGAATFSNAAVNYHKGTNALLVTVSNPGSASNSVRMVSSSFNASSTNTYVLRFWANTDKVGANLGVNLIGATPVYPQISFKISTNSLVAGDQHYQEYLYAFKASGAVSIAFNFQTTGQYWLDDVEVLDVVNNDGFDVPMIYLWQWGQWNFAQTNSLKIGWTGGDNDKSVILPDGNVAWIFNDSFSSTLNSFYSNIRGGSSLPRNALVHQIGTNLVWKNNGNNPYFLPSHVNDTQMPLNPNGLYWIAGGIAESNKLFVLLNGLNNSPLTNVCMAVATLSLPNMTLDGVVTNLTSPGTDNFGDLVRGDDGYYYIYNGAKVARVPAGQLAVDSAWRYWNGSAWVTDHTQSTNASASLPNFQGWSITRLGTSNYVAVYKPVLSVSIYAQFAPTPMGPWSNGTLLYTADVEGEQGIFNVYMPNICAGTDSNGVYTIGYSDNGGDTEGWFTKLNNDKSWYNPHFITANLLQLSPYTPGITYPMPNGPNLALNKTVVVSSTENSGLLGPYAVDGNLATRWGSLYSDPQWIYVDLGSTQTIGQVRLFWESAYGKAYQIQVSTDASTWTTAFSKANGSGGYETNNFTPVTGRYVRMYGTQRGTGWGYSLLEFQIYAPYTPPTLSATVALPSTTVYAGMSVSLVCSNYSGPAPRSFQWQKSANGIGYAGIGGATTNFLTLPVVTTNDSAYYRLVFTANGEAVTNSALQLTVNPPARINVQPIGGKLILSWPQGVLLEATNITGPWTTNNATSPYTNQPNNPQMFYRVQLQ